MEFFEKVCTDSDSKRDVGPVNDIGQTLGQIFASHFFSKAEPVEELRTLSEAHESWGSHEYKDTKCRAAGGLIFPS